MPDRRPDFDWLRVLAIVILHFFHVGMMFNTWDWHLKAPVQIEALEPWMEALHLVRMPLLMVISGAGTAFALRRRSLKTFAWDRTKRLFLPLWVGMLLVVPPQIWIERVTKEGLTQSYLEFWPSVFRLVSYPEGNTSWHHLWFIAYLFLYCLFALPLFAWLERPSGAAFLARLDRFLSRGANVLWMIAPLALVQIAFHRWPETHGLFDDPQTFGFYALLFVAGHLLARCPSVWDHLARHRGRFLFFLVPIVLAMAGDDEFPLVFERLGQCAFTWGAILAAFGFARAHIHERRPWLARAQELSYPFYIFHQTVIIVVGFFVLPIVSGPWIQMPIVFVISFALTWFSSELAARVEILRPLFGLKPRAVQPPGRILAANA